MTSRMIGQDSPAFGVVVTTSEADHHLARGCCASIRRFMGDVPIAMFVDGNVPTRPFEQIYGASIHRAEDLASPELRKIGFGWGRTKMAALWEAPWPTALFVDADTVVLGDVRRYVDFNQVDVVTDRHFFDTYHAYFTRSPLDRFLCDSNEQDASVAAHLAGWFFQPALVQARYPSFDWRSALPRVFCPGALFARRGCLDLEDYLRLHKDRIDGSGIVASGDMGVLNIMVLKAAQERSVRLAQSSDLHVLAFQHEDKELERRFPLGDDGTPLMPNRTSVLHWSGHPKPSISGAGIYPELMNSFRRAFRKASGEQMRDLIDARLVQEDEQYNRTRQLLDTHPTKPEKALH